jgi:hypothetical protein
VFNSSTLVFNSMHIVDEELLFMYELCEIFLIAFFSMILSLASLPFFQIMCFMCGVLTITCQLLNRSYYLRNHKYFDDRI